MKKVMWLVLALVLLIPSIWLMLKRSDTNYVNSSLKSENAVVARRDLDSKIIVSGVIKPMAGAEVKVGSKVSGIVKNLLVNIGDFVSKGQLLAELDQSELQAILDQEQAAKRSNDASYSYANSFLERQRTLHKYSLISHEQMEAAEKALNVASADLSRAEANVEAARVLLDYTKIISPISGIVASILTQQGETVAASFLAPTFVTIIDLQQLEVWAYIDEVDIGRIKKAQRVIFGVSAYPYTEFEGTVSVIHPKAILQGDNTRYVSAIKINDRKGQVFRPEMTTTVSIFAETRQKALTIPNRAIRWKNKQPFVMLPQQDQQAPRRIKIGWRDENYTEIMDGLDEGEMVLLDERN